MSERTHDELCVRIAKAWDELISNLGHQYDVTNNIMAQSAEFRQKFAGLVYEYLVEAQHGSFDGWEDHPEQLEGVAQFIEDMVSYQKSM